MRMFAKVAILPSIRISFILYPFLFLGRGSPFFVHVITVGGEPVVLQVSVVASRSREVTTGGARMEMTLLVHIAIMLWFIYSAGKGKHT